MDISRQSEDRIEDFRSMMQLENPLIIKIGMNLKNPHLFKNFFGSDVANISVADYAYAAGLISKAEADYLNHLPIEIDDNGNGEDDDHGGMVS